LAGYEFYLTDLGDLITSEPPPVTATVALVGNNAVLTWTAVPYQYSYSVYTATSPLGPWTVKSSGLTFTNSAGTYTDVNTVSANSPKFYRVQTP
jgi:hypothetical protein